MLFTLTGGDTASKVEIAKQIFVSSGAAEATKEAIQTYTNKAFSVLNSLHISEENKTLLKRFGTDLMNRKV